MTKPALDIKSYNKIFVLKEGGGQLIKEMFAKNNFLVVNSVENANLVCFTGGEDVSPEFYGQSKHSTTNNNRARDEKEQQLYYYCLGLELGFVGICRGGQFLNVMNNGTMWQNVDNHAIGKMHKLHDIKTETDVWVTSTHHQMMIPDANSELVAYANEATKLEDAEKTFKVKNYKDTEVVWYPETKTLCYQPHPEYTKPGERNTDYFFELLHRYFAKED